MFYEPSKNNHGLTHNPFKSCVVPRPIGWISTRDLTGKPNLAPYSYFNAICDNPAMVMFAATTTKIDHRIKDSVTNAEETGEFVVNIATYELREAMNKTSAELPVGANEFELAQLETEASVLVKSPRVKLSPIHLECTYYQTILLPTNNPAHQSRLVLGKVIGVHIADHVIVDGKVDLKKVLPIGRLGYMEYGVIDNIFTMQRPD